MSLSLYGGAGTSSILARATRSAMSRNASLIGKGAVRGAVRQLSSASATDGELWAWGHNDEGNMKDPVFLPEARNVVQVSVGLFHGAAVTAGGTLFTWGRGEGGRLGNNVDAWNRSRGGVFALHCPDPHAVDLQGPLMEQGVKDLPYCVAVAAGGLHTLALMSDGRTMGFGFGRWGQLGFGPECPKIVGLPRQLLLLHPARHIVAGGSHSAAITTDGVVRVWGRSDDGRLGIGPVDSDTVPAPVPLPTLDALGGVKALSLGGFSSAAISSATTGLWTWGAGENGELGTGKTVSETIPTMVGEVRGEKVAQVAMGGYHGALLTENGEVLTWGRGVHGQLGHGTRQQELVPRVVKGLPPAAQVACGGGHTVVRGRDGSVWTFGGNSQGELGLGSGSELQVFTPQRIEKWGDKFAYQVAAGGSRSAAILAPPPGGTPPRQD
mmetsp:Transcript_59707/g.141340  ORF Transcript_59707/g.141340 Transcript_59707/m.141340 type:complete len:438 (-) Transcript_59707:102-1415(-)